MATATATGYKLFEATITPHHAGFGMWQVGEYSEFGAGEDNVFETPDDALAVWQDYCGDAGISVEKTDEIGGRVYDEPSCIYKWTDDDGNTRYYGVDIREAH